MMTRRILAPAPAVIALALVSLAIAQHVGIKNVGVGLGKPPNGVTLDFAPAENGAIAARLSRSAPPGSRLTLRDAANRVLATPPVAPDGTVRFPERLLEQAQTACLESPGAQPACGDLEPAKGTTITKSVSNIRNNRTGATPGANAPLTQLEPAPQPCPPGQRPPCAPVRAPFGQTQRPQSSRDFARLADGSYRELTPAEAAAYKGKKDKEVTRCNCGHGTVYFSVPNDLKDCFAACQDWSRRVKGLAHIQ